VKCHAECQDLPVQPGNAQELRVITVALSLHAQHNLQWHMNKLGRKAWAFIAAISEGLEHAIFYDRPSKYVGNQELQLEQGDA